jgi:SPP1 gp7 family putative phage head morphogenesis protein
MSIRTDSPIYQKAFEQYLRRGTPIEVSLKALMLKAETVKNHTTALYRWRTAGDDNVRPSHAANEGRIFSWGNSPSTGHPGEEVNCRCTAEPVELDTTPLEVLALLSGAGIARRVGVRVGREIIRRIERGREKPPVQKPQSPADILAPNGQAIGRDGMRPKVRIVKGGEKEARELFEKLTKDGIPEKRAGYSGIGKRLPNGDWIGYRGVSKSGSPTIDMDVKGVNFNKIHFYE